jgi:WD40 repeat protein
MKAIDFNGPRLLNEIQRYQHLEIDSADRNREAPAEDKQTQESQELLGPGREDKGVKSKGALAAAKKNILESLTGKILELKKFIDFGAAPLSREIKGVALTRLYGIDVKHKSSTLCAHDDRANTGRSLKFIYFYQKVVVIFFYKFDIQEFYFQHQNQITAITLSSNSLVASADFGVSALVLVWDLVTKQTLKVVPKLHFLPIQILKFFGGNRYLFSASFGRHTHIVIYDLKRDEVCLSFLEIEKILELSDPAAGTAPFAPPSQLLYITDRQIQLLTSQDSAEGVHFVREKCVLTKVKNFAPLTAFFSQRNPDGSLQVVLGHENGAVTIWRNFDYQYTLCVYEGVVQSIVLVPQIGMVVQHGATDLSIWNHTIEKQYRLLDSGNLRLLKLPFLSALLCIGLQHRLFIVTSFLEIIQLKFAPNLSYAGKKRIKRLLPILSPRLHTSEFFIKSRGGLSYLIFPVSEHTLVLYDLESSDYNSSFHFNGTKILGFDAHTTPAGLWIAVATADGFVHYVVNEELKDQLRCFEPKEFLRVRLTSNPDLCVILLTRNRIQFRMLDAKGIGKVTLGSLAIEEVYLNFLDLKYFKKTEKFALFSNKNVMHKVENLKGRATEAMMSENEFFSSKFVYHYYESNEDVQKCILLKSGLTVFYFRNMVGVVAKDEDLRTGSYLRLEFGLGNLKGIVFKAATNSLIAADERGFFKIGLTLDDFDYEALSASQNGVLSWNDRLREELSVGTRLWGAGVGRQPFTFADSFAYAAWQPPRSKFEKNVMTVVPKQRFKPYKRQTVEANSVFMAGKRYPLSFLKLRRIYGFQGLHFRNSLAYVHVYKGHFLQPIDQLPLQRTEPSQTVEVASRFLDEMIASKYKYYPYDRQHKACSKEMVYFLSKYAVIFDSKTNRQRFYSSHDNQISAIAVSNSKVLVATGDSSAEGPCFVHVWSARDEMTQAVFECKLFNHVSLLRFSNYDEFLAAAGFRAANSNHFVDIFDVKSRLRCASVALGENMVLDLQFNNYVPNEFTVAGMNLIQRLTFNGSQVSRTQHIRLYKENETGGGGSDTHPVRPKSRPASRGPHKSRFVKASTIDSNSSGNHFLCITVCQYFYYLLGEKLDTDFIIGTADGDIGIVAFGNYKFAQQGHSKQVNAIRVTDVMQNIVIIISAGEDGLIKFWNTKFELISQMDLHSQSFSLDVMDRSDGDESQAFNHSAQSLDIFACDSSNGAQIGGDRQSSDNLPKILLVGTRTNELLEIVLSTEFLGITTQQTGTLILNKKVFKNASREADISIFDLKKREKIIFDTSLIVRFNSNGPFYAPETPAFSQGEDDDGSVASNQILNLKHKITAGYETLKRQLKFELCPNAPVCVSYGTNEDVLFWNLTTQCVEERILVSPFPLVVRFIPRQEQVMMVLNDNRIVLYGYKVVTKKLESGETRTSITVNTKQKSEASLSCLSLLYIDATLLQNKYSEDDDLSDEASISPKIPALAASSIRESRIRQSEFFCANGNSYRGYFLYLHQILIVDGSKYEQTDLEILRMVRMRLKKAADGEGVVTEVLAQKDFKIQYSKNNPIFEREPNSVNILSVEKIYENGDGNLVVGVKKQVQKMNFKSELEGVYHFGTSYDDKILNDFQDYLTPVDGAEDPCESDFRLSRVTYAGGAEEGRGGTEAVITASCVARAPQMYLLGAESGEILITKDLNPFVLADDRTSKDHFQDHPNIPRGSILETRNQVRICPAHSARVTKILVNADATTVLTTGLNESCLLVWDLVQSKPFYDLDGLFYDTRIRTSRQQEAISPKDFEKLVKENQQVKLELLHLKEQVAPGSRIELKLDRVIGRTARDVRNNIALTYDNKVVFCVGSLVCLMPLKPSETRQEFLMTETQMEKHFIAPQVAALALSNDRRFLCVGTLEDPATLYFWEVCSKICFHQLKLPEVVQVIYLGYSHADLHVLAVCLTTRYTQAVYLLRNEPPRLPRVRAVCEMRYSPVFKIQAFAFMPDNAYEFVTAGEQHLARWKVQNETLMFQEVRLEINDEINKAGNYHQVRHKKLVDEHGYVDPKQIQSVFQTVAYIEPELLMTGSVDGTIHFWHNYSLVMIETGHMGAAILCSATSPFHQSGLTRALPHRRLRRHRQPLQDQERPRLEPVHPRAPLRLQAERKRAGTGHPEPDFRGAVDSDGLR